MSLGKLFLNKKESDKRMNELKENIKKLKDEIKNLINILNTCMENIEAYYNINNDINNSFNIKSINYEILNNIKEINNNEINDDIKRIINQKSECDKFKQIFNIYTLMNSKKELNSENNLNFKINGINNNSQNVNFNNFHNNSINNNNNNFNSNMNNFNPNLNQNFNMNMNNNNFMNPNMMMNNFNPNISPSNLNNFNQNMNLNNNYNFTMNNMNNMMMQMLNNYDEYEEWMKEFGIEDSIKIIFNTTQGKKTEVSVKKGTTIDQLLKKYLELENRSYLIDYKRIVFLFNAIKLKFGDNTKVEKFFKNTISPKIVINDLDYVISEGDKNIIFSTSNGGRVNFKFGINSSLEQLLNYYFVFIEKNI